MKLPNSKKQTIISRLLEKNEITPEEAIELQQENHIIVPIQPIDNEPFGPIKPIDWPQISPQQKWIQDELDRRALHAQRCACNPANGGSGMCGCTLASPIIYC